MFLQCQPLTHSIEGKYVVDSKWNCTAKAEFVIKSHKVNVRDFSRRMEPGHTFHAAGDDWGFPKFMQLEVHCVNSCLDFSPY